MVRREARRVSTITAETSLRQAQMRNKSGMSEEQAPGQLFITLVLAHERGRGGVVEVATITGMSRTTIRRGVLEIQRAVPESSDRVRRPGGGRKRIEKKIPI